MQHRGRKPSTPTVGAWFKRPARVAGSHKSQPTVGIARQPGQAVDLLAVADPAVVMVRKAESQLQINDGKYWRISAVSAERVPLEK
jgi:hypothetical protein